VRRPFALGALGVALAFVGYMAYAVVRFVFESWQFNEVAQGLIQIPIWIPQMSFVLGALILFVAVLDEFVVLARGGTPAYETAEAARRASKDFSETV
jgi:TRAP-type C4-dicarboxylate transport system permease small subunit